MENKVVHDYSVNGKNWKVEGTLNQSPIDIPSLFKMMPSTSISLKTSYNPSESALIDVGYTLRVNWVSSLKYQEA
jgi:hypothetical protein